MSSHPQWSLWIIRSLSSYFKLALAAYTIYIEGDYHDTNELPIFFELRVDGPDIEEVSKDDYELTIITNIVAQIAMVDDEVALDDKYLGLIASVADVGISIYRYGLVGEHSDNDDSLLGCLKVIKGPTIHKFGQIDANIKELQGTVETHYMLAVQS